MYHSRNEYGFTLIEMMTTVALIGILTAVATVKYGDIRARANLHDAESAMQNARGAITLCVFRNSNINAPNPANLTCNGSDIRWPNIGQFAGGWSYTGAADQDVSDRTFSFSAAGPGASISCDQDGCTTTEI